ncbi:MFS transporter [Streptomyces sp. NPDC052687]|uniref:MFS transporter n=1 Tax=Streptomyces sp. NPDC052687 TaxID=3154759 RepID=UPI00341A7D6F
MPPPADGARTESEPRAPGLLSGPYRSRTLAIAATFFLVAFAGLALATAMPVAVQELDALPLYAIAFGGYLAAGLAGTVVGGGWADRRGPAAPLKAGCLCFVGGSALAGAAPSIMPFLAGRLAQGAGGGAVTVALYVMVGRGYPPALRPRMFSVVTACWILPSMVGPAIAGAVTEHLSWRWVFHGIAVFTLATTALLRRPLAALPHDGAAAEETATRVGPAVTVAVGAGLLQYAAAQPSPRTAVLAVAGLLAVAAGLRGLLPAGTLRARPGIPALVLVRGLAAAAYFATESYVPLLLVNERGWSPTAAGYSLTCAALAWAAASWLQGRPRLSPRRRHVILLGALVHSAGTALTLAGVLRAAPAVTAPAGFTVAAFGMGLLLPSVGVLTLDQSPPGRQGANTAALQVADSLCSVLLIGVCGALFGALHTAAGSDTAAFAAVCAAALATTLLAAPAARRVGAPAPEAAAPKDQLA